MKKRIISLAVILGLSLGLAGCGNTKTFSKENDEQVDETTSATTAEENADEIGDLAEVGEQSTNEAITLEDENEKIDILDAVFNEAETENFEQSKEEKSSGEKKKKKVSFKKVLEKGTYNVDVYSTNFISKKKGILCLTNLNNIVSYATYPYSEYAIGKNEFVPIDKKCVYKKAKSFKVTFEDGDPCAKYEWEDKNFYKEYKKDDFMGTHWKKISERMCFDAGEGYEEMPLMLEFEVNKKGWIVSITEYFYS